MADPPSPTPAAPAGLPTPAQFAFLTRLAQLLHGYGTPAHRLDDTVIRCASGLGVAAQVFSTPTLLMAAFGVGPDQRTHMLEQRPRDIDLGALIEIDAVCDDVEAGRDAAEQGLARLEEIAAAPSRHGVVLTTASFGLASAGAAALFGGGLGEIVVSLLLGIASGLLARVTGRRTHATRLFEPAAACLAAFLAILATRLYQPLSPGIVTLSALIVLVPGLSLTLAMTEMATRHLMSGTTRLAGVLTVFMTIGLGVAVGRTLAGGPLFEEGAFDSGGPLPSWVAWPVVVVSTGAFLVLFQARWRDAGWILAAGLIAFAGARTGAALLGPELGGFLGAIAIGLGSNLYAHHRSRPASVPLLPGILMLVPGSIGYRSLDFFLSHDVLSGMEAAFRMTLVAVSLVGGLLVANVVFTPRRVL